jgi:thioredoxin 1
MSRIHHFSDQNFQHEVLQSDDVVVVDFWAPWCGPCRLLGPTIEKLANVNPLHVKVGKLNVDESPQAAAEFGIHSIPTVLVFRQGEEVARTTGVVPPTVYQASIDTWAHSREAVS